MSAVVRRLLMVVVIAGLVAAVVGCGDDEVITAPPATAPPANVAAAPDGGAGDAGVATEAGPPLPVIEFTESDFVESDDTRDPFRSFARLFLRQAKTKSVVQRTVHAAQFSLEQLTLSGVITGSTPRAMLIDPTGYAWVLRTGDYVARAELVSSGGPSAEDVAMNWRIDRIRGSSLLTDPRNPDQPIREIPANIVLVREDPSRSDLPASTRVLYMRAGSDEPPQGG